MSDEDSSTPSEDDEQYATRSATLPDGRSFTLAYKPGYGIEEMSDEEFIEKWGPDAMLRSVPHLRAVDDGPEPDGAP